MTVPLRVLGIIPARAGSKRVPGKNLRELGGVPLVTRAIETALAAQRIDRLVVSSDDPKTLQIAGAYDRVTGLRRPLSLASDESLAIDYVKHALGEVEGRVGYGAIVIVQPTSPFTLATDIDDTIDLLIRSGADSAVTVARVDQLVHPLKLKLLDGDRLRPFLEEERGRMAAHEIPDVYVRNGAVYATRREVVERGEIIGPDCRGMRMPRERSCDINEEIDFAFAEFLLARGARIG